MNLRQTSSSNARCLSLLIAFALMLAGAMASAQSSSSGSGGKQLEIQADGSGLHIGTDGDARKAGFPLYPGARPQKDPGGGHDDALNLGLVTDDFGFNLVVAKYESSDAPGRVIDFYRHKLKKYGSVLECHTHEHGGDVNAAADSGDPASNSDASAPVTCEGDNTGPVTELKVGTKSNQHVVAIEPNGQGSVFGLVYVHSRGRRGEI